MSQNCLLCGGQSDASGKDGSIICSSCTTKITTAIDNAAKRALLDTVETPVLLMQAEPRLVVTANRKALALFGKTLEQVEGQRGGNVFDCINAFTFAGCGKDIHCESCRIKAAVIDAFAGKNSLSVSNLLGVLNGESTRHYNMQVSTAQVGQFAMLRIDRYHDVTGQ